MGFEPMTSFLPRMRSTPELRGQLQGGPGRTRTCEGIMPAELQSAPFATRDTDP